MESISTTIREPIFTFALLLGIIFLVPPIFEKLKLPGLVGLLVAGVIFGGSGLGLLNSKSETMVLLADHVCPPGTAKETKAHLYERLETLAKSYLPGAIVNINVVARNNSVSEILQASRQCELVILRSQRQRVGVDSLALSASTKPLLENLNCSIILLGEL